MADADSTRVPGGARVVGALILAGGRSTRLGRSKPLAVVGGRTLLARSIRAVAEWPGVVVGGPELAPVLAEYPGVGLTREEPAFGGPVAAIGAGLVHFDELGSDGFLLVLSCDLPRAEDAVAALVAATSGLDAATAGVCLRADGRAQWLCGAYRVGSLRARVAALGSSGGLDGASVRDLLGPLDVDLIDDIDGVAFDVDTPADLASAEERMARDITR